MRKGPQPWKSSEGPAQQQVEGRGCGQGGAMPWPRRRRAGAGLGLECRGSEAAGRWVAVAWVWGAESRARTLGPAPCRAGGLHQDECQQAFGDVGLASRRRLGSERGPPCPDTWPWEPRRSGGGGISGVGGSHCRVWRGQAGGATEGSSEAVGQGSVRKPGERKVPPGRVVQGQPEETRQWPLALWWHW